MFKSEMEVVENFRNHTGTKFFFDKEMNFIVGENKIDMTNVMELLNSLLHKDIV